MCYCGSWKALVMMHSWIWYEFSKSDPLFTYFPLVFLLLLFIETSFYSEYLFLFYASPFFLFSCRWTTFMYDGFFLPISVLSFLLDFNVILSRKNIPNQTKNLSNVSVVFRLCLKKFLMDILHFFIGILIKLIYILVKGG